MTINTSDDLSKKYTSQLGLTQRIITDFLPDNFLAATSPRPISSTMCQKIIHTTGHYYLLIIMAIMYVARLTRTDVLLATAYLAIKAQHPKRVTIKQCCVSSPT